MEDFRIDSPTTSSQALIIEQHGTARDCAAGNRSVQEGGERHTAQPIESVPAEFAWVDPAKFLLGHKTAVQAFEKPAARFVVDTI
jgi:hypothetical protein